MKNLDEFRIANELLNEVFGGNQVTPRVYSFSGVNAVAEARKVAIIDSACACGCGCSGGAGNGGGSGN